MTADSGARGTDRDVHYAKCNGSLCPCYLDGLRAANVALAADGNDDEIPNDVHGGHSV